MTEEKIKDHNRAKEPPYIKCIKMFGDKVYLIDFAHIYIYNFIGIKKREVSSYEKF